MDELWAVDPRLIAVELESKAFVCKINKNSFSSAFSQAQLEKLLLVRGNFVLSWGQMNMDESAHKFRNQWVRNGFSSIKGHSQLYLNFPILLYNLAAVFHLGLNTVALFCCLFLIVYMYTYLSNDLESLWFFCSLYCTRLFAQIP